MTHQRLFDPSTVNARQFTPVAVAQQGAAALTGGQWSDEGLGDRQVDPVRGHATFLAYRDKLRGPAERSETPGLRQSYDVMAQHVDQQYRHMTTPVEQGGMGLRHEIVPHDPYPTPGDMAADVGRGRIQTLSTKTTGSHEYFSDEQNDKFRAVHDMFGHAATGRGFSRHGEEAAYLSHKQMFPSEAHAALASETRGQNSYLNYGPGGFASQEGRLVGLPKWAQETGPVPPAPKAPVNPNQFGKQMRLF
jgi:hypothetical protein